MLPLWRDPDFQRLFGDPRHTSWRDLPVEAFRTVGYQWVIWAGELLIPAALTLGIVAGWLNFDPPILIAAFWVAMTIVALLLSLGLIDLVIFVSRSFGTWRRRG